MTKNYFKGWHKVTLLFFLLCASLYSETDLILCNDNLINKRAIGEISKIGTEVKEKTGISIYLCAKKSINNQKIRLYEKNLIKKLNKPFILLTVAANEQKVDIMTSPQTAELIDANEILSPFTGTIIPILTEKKGHDKYSAAMLNGYADIADRVSDKLGIELKSSIGNTNRIFVNILRVIIYGSFLYFVIMYIRKKILYKKNK